MLEFDSWGCLKQCNTISVSVLVCVCLCSSGDSFVSDVVKRGERNLLCAFV